MTAETMPQLPALREKVNTIRGLMERNKGAFMAALPRHMNADRLIRVALTSFNVTPKLLDCTPRSLLGAVIQCAQLGLEPGVLGHAYLIPYGKDVQLVVGYKGLIQLARRSGEISTIAAHEVHAKDKFSYQYGLEPKLVHVPSEESDRGPVTHFYAVVRLKDGGAQFEVMTKAQVDAHRDRYSRAAKQGPWVTEYPEMGKKTVLRRVLKLSPASIEVQQAVDLDERAELQLPQHLGDVSGLPAEDEGNGGKLDALTATLEEQGSGDAA
jgi:recombination protein RecT